jgi:hypothetical protein
MLESGYGAWHDRGMAGPFHIEPSDPAEVADRMFRQKARWFEIIKAVRSAGGLSIFEAERLALGHEGWRRWCEARINSDPQCRKLAAGHIRFNGEKALIRKVGDSFTFR